MRAQSNVCDLVFLTSVGAMALFNLTSDYKGTRSAGLIAQRLLNHENFQHFANLSWKYGFIMDVCCAAFFSCLFSKPLRPLMSDVYLHLTKVL